jgi:Family of unknown function (DUF6529)
VAVALYVAGRLLRPDYEFSMFGSDPVPAKSLLASIVLALAGVQVLLALWMYRKLPQAAVRAGQQGENWQEDYKRRAGIGGAVSQAVTVTGCRLR